MKRADIYLIVGAIYASNAFTHITNAVLGFVFLGASLFYCFKDKK